MDEFSVKRKEVTHTFTVAGKEVKVQTGGFAWQSHGAVMLTMGGTTLLATCSIDAKDAGLDYFPLNVEYIEKMYARGAISGSKFRKREGMPSDEATIKAREVDHSIRSLFPKSFKKSVMVILTVLAYDGENDPQALTVLGASLAVMQSGIPFAGPASSVIAAIEKDGKVVLNPSPEHTENFEAEWIIAGVDGKILCLEGWGKEISEEKMDEVLDVAMAEIIKINAAQSKFIDEAGKTLEMNFADYDNTPVSEEVLNFVKDNAKEEIKTAMFNDKVERNSEIATIRDGLNAKVKESELEYSELDISLAVDYISRRVLRDAVLNEDKRVSGRKLEEIRPLSASVDILPTVHGSAMFNRGLTQSLSIVTLAPSSFALLSDDMEGEESKTFMHHYNFPPFSTGEAGRYKYYPGRREIGHGAIGENALKYMIPSIEEFPYTIRAVSEILSSNGSTSMAATCAASMALMAAGVPLKEQVAGIGVGLVTEDGNEDNYKLLLDIEGVEDFYGDMDFKVCGTKNGITSIQYENKLQGVRLDVIKKAFRLAKEGRAQVLEVMNKVISSPRAELPKNAPKIEMIKIDQDEIGALIGPGGKNIKALVEESKKYGKEAAGIDIKDSGEVLVSAFGADQMDFVKNKIIGMFEKAEVGKTYTGIVDKIVEFGAFVDVSNSITGLVHVSEMSDKFVKDPNTIVKKGQQVNVKVLKVENGKTSFTMKNVEQPKAE